MRKILGLFILLFVVQQCIAQTPGKVLVETYDSKGNKVQKIRQKDGRIVRRTVISLGKAVNAPFDPDTIDKNRIVIQVYKKYHRLYVYYKGQFLTTYNCVFGKNPKGQKLYEGDKRTPEGWFTVTNVRKHGKWNYFIDFDYPNLESYRNHEAAKKKGLIPKNSRIGGLVGLHGIWSGGDNAIKSRFNWTDGCVALTNDNIEHLASIVQPGTRVYIGWEK